MVGFCEHFMDQEGDDFAYNLCFTVIRTARKNSGLKRFLEH